MSMSSLSEIIYCPLKEEEESLVGWSKETIDYVLDNRMSTYSQIRGIAKSLNRSLQLTDVEDIYEEILCYLYGCDDYNTEKAIDRSNRDGAIVSLEGYVGSCVKFCVIRHVTKEYEQEKEIVRETVSDTDGKELSLFDTITDRKTLLSYEDEHCDLEDVCKTYQYKRYEYGPDIFQVWFVRLQTMIHDKQDAYADILVALGISRKEIHDIEKTNDTVMLMIARAITVAGVDKAVEIIREYTYSADRIEKVVELYEK